MNNPEGYVLVQVKQLAQWREWANNVAAWSTKADRSSEVARLKASISSAMISTTQPTASNAGEREDFEAWADRTQPAYWRTTAWAREAWPMWRDMRAALATKPPAGEQKPVEHVELYGVKDGKETRLGTVPMPPRMKARQIARVTFGPFEENDGSDADMCFAAMESLIDHMQTVTQPEQVAQDSDVLAYLDDLKDDAIAHIWPDDLERCQTRECTVTVASVRLGSPNGHTLPLFSRKQVADALRAARARGEGGRNADQA